MSGVAIECATSRVEISVLDREGETRVTEVEDVGQGHTRRVTPLLCRALARARVSPRGLEWVAADLGPGSFTGVRVGLATAQALAAAHGTSLLGASSLAALAHSTPRRRGLVVPLVPAGRSQVYAGFFRTDGRAQVRLLAAPRVVDLAELLVAIEEARRVSEGASVRCVGPGVPRWREALETRFPGATALAWRFEGLSAEDLARAALTRRGPAAGLPIPGEEPKPLYIRSAQAEERVRHRASALEPITLRLLEQADVPAISRIERQVFTDPWPDSFFIGELSQPQVYARVAERAGELAGYSVAWLGAGSGHLGNLAVAPGQRRRGVARALLLDLLERARRQDVESLTLEVRVSNFAAQALYRAHGFRLAGLRRGYYRDSGEDALIMEWRAPTP